MPISSIYILTACIRVFNSYSFLVNSLMSFMYINIIIIIYSSEFFTSVLADGLSREFEWQQVPLSLQDSSQYLAVLNNIVVWMVFTRPLISKSSCPFDNPLVTVPKAPITIGIIYTFMFHKFFNSLASVTLCRWSAKQTIPLSVLARNQTKGLDSRSPTRRK